MFCPKCGKEIPDDALFCSSCGSKIEKSEEKVEKKKSSSPLKIIIAIISFILILVALIFFIIKYNENKLNKMQLRIEVGDGGREYFVINEGDYFYNTWVEYKDNWYVSDGEGYIMKDAWYLHNGKYYYLNDKGIMEKNHWEKSRLNDSKYYVDENGEMVLNRIVRIDNKDYAFDEMGALIENRFFRDFNDIHKMRFSNENGEVEKGNKFIDYLGFTYYIDENGFVVLDAWVLYKGDYYYLLNNGILARSMWIARTYYVDQDGKRLYSTKTPDGYDVDENGAIIGKLRSEKSTRYNLKFVSSDVSEFPKIKLYYKIYDEKGNVVSDFNIYEAKLNEQLPNGTVQVRPVQISESISKRYGLNSSLIVDRSTSLNNTDLTKIKNAMRRFVSSMDYAVGDMCEIISFGSDVLNVCSFTNNLNTLNNGIDSIALNGSTAFYDAVYRGINHAYSQSGARCVIAFTDGQDNMSTHTMQDVINYSLRQQVPVYIVGVGSSVSKTDLESLAYGTGGRYWNIDNIGDIERVYTDIYGIEKSTFYIEYVTDNLNNLKYAQRNIDVVLDNGIEYVELNQSITPPREDQVVDEGNKNNNSSSNTNNTGGSSSSAVANLTLVKDTTKSISYEYDDDNNVKLMIVQLKVKGDPYDEDEINELLVEVAEEFEGELESVVDSLSKIPRTVNLTSYKLESATSKNLSIILDGVITYRSSGDTSNIGYRINISRETYDYEIIRIN